MRARLIRSLLRRRVLHAVGLYLAGGWALLEFSSWGADRGLFPDGVVNLALLLLAAGLPAVGAAAWTFGGRADAEHVSWARPAPPRSVAVLPFANLSTDAADAFLGDGISDEIMSVLARVPELRVASRTSAFAFRDRDADIREIGVRLRVGTVLEGSVRRAGERLRVTTRLVDASEGYQLWAAQYDTELEDVFRIQAQIAENVARVLRVILEKGERDRVPERDLRAWEYYQRGREFFHRARRKSLRYARQMFERAVAVDPGYARAHAALAEAIAVECLYYPSAISDIAEAERASLRALELEPELAEAHMARGAVLFLLHRYEESARELDEATRLDPRLFDAWYFKARMHFQTGRLEEAAELFRRANEVREDYSAAFFRGQALEALDRDEEAVAAYACALEVVERHMDLNPDDPRAATMRAVALGRVGRMGEGLAWAGRAVEIDPEDAGVRYNVACFYALSGERDRALDALEGAVRVGFGNREWIERDPDLDSVRDAPRFQAVLEAMAS